MAIRFVLQRPRNAGNIGAAARALKNTGAGGLWLVDPLGFDRAHASKLAAGADDVLDAMKLARTLDEALDDCVCVVMTTGRETPGALLPEQVAAMLVALQGEAAIVFGDERDGLSNADLRRASCASTIPTAGKASLNLAQAVLIYGYELLKARGPVSLPVKAEEPPADERLLRLIRERARPLLMASGFLNPQQPELALDQLAMPLRRTRPTQREAEMMLAALAHLARHQI